MHAGCSRTVSTRGSSPTGRGSRRSLGSVARELPYQTHDVLEALRSGTFSMTINSPGVDHIDQHLHQASNRIAVALIVAGGLVGSSVIGVFAKSGPHIMGLHLFSFLGFVVSAAFGFWLVWGILRHSRL